MCSFDLPQKKKLIVIVEANPDLWQQTKKTPISKQRLWDSVGAEMGTTGANVRYQWGRFLDHFRSEYKKFTCNRTYKSKWVLYDRMLFVRNALELRENEEQGLVKLKPLELEVDVTQMVNIKSEFDSSVPKIQVRQDLQEVTINEHGEEGGAPGVSSSCQRSKYDENDYSREGRKRRRLAESSDDEDYHFVMSILPSLRSIQQTKKLRFRSKIMELIATELETDFRARN